MKVTRIIEDISFVGFIREVIYCAKKHPKAEFTTPSVGDDVRAEGAFMFHIAMEYERKE